MKNNKPLIITLIIILSILAISVIALLVFLLTDNGKFNLLFHDSFNNYSNEIIHDEYYKNNYNLIDIKNNLGDINLMPSEDNRIHVLIYGEKDLLTINDSESLSITYKAKPCIGFCFNQPSSKIEVYLPSTYNKKINIENKAGDIRVSDFTQASFKIESDLGDTIVGRVKDIDIINHAGDMEIDSSSRIKAVNDLGDIKINKVNEYLDIRDKCGDIEINNLNISENSRIENNLGDIEIKHTNDIKIEVDVDLGDKKVNNSNYKSDIILDIKNNCGDVEVN